MVSPSSDIWHSPHSPADSHHADSSQTQSPSTSIPPTPSPTSAAHPRRKALSPHSSTLNSFSGAVAGIASGIVTCPLDVIKTRLQNQKAFNHASSISQIPGPTSYSSTQYRGMVGSAKVIFQQEGVKGFYRGLGPLLLGYLPTWAVYMGVYDVSREHYATVTDNKWLSRVYASLTAGCCSTLATNPIWVIKTRLMSQSIHREHPLSVHYHSSWDAVRKMYRTEGIRSFYSGLVPGLFGLTHVAIQFPLYEYLKFRFTGLEMGEHPPEGEGNHYFGIMAATFFSKICATSVTYPHEVLRTRLQNQRLVTSSPAWTAPVPPDSSTARSTSVLGRSAPISVPYAGVIRTINTMMREEGWRAFYAGMGTNMFRAVPAAMTTMLTFEFVKSTLQGASG